MLRIETWDQMTDHAQEWNVEPDDAQEWNVEPDDTQEWNMGPDHAQEWYLGPDDAAGAAVSDYFLASSEYMLILVWGLVFFITYFKCIIIGNISR